MTSDGKKYQVFISSTFTDLPEERRAVMEMVMKMGCIPAGMEFFGAVDEEQLEFIKTIIDDCDYYLVIVGGRYGTPTSDGVSDTEKEYEYALSKGMKVIGLLHGKPNDIAAGKSESDPSLKQKLEEFRKKLKDGRLVDFWENAGDLQAKTVIALTNAFNRFPAVGWIRANKVTNVEALTELHDLRKTNDELKRQLEAATPPTLIPDLAGLDEVVTVGGTHKVHDRSSSYTWKVTLTWRLIARAVLPHLITLRNDAWVRATLVDALAKSASDVPTHAYAFRVSDEVFHMIRSQLVAHSGTEFGRCRSAAWLGIARQRRRPRPRISSTWTQTLCEHWRASVPRKKWQ